MEDILKIFTTEDKQDLRQAMKTIIIDKFREDLEHYCQDYYVFKTDSIDDLVADLTQEVHQEITMDIKNQFSKRIQQEIEQEFDLSDMFNRKGNREKKSQ